MKMNKLAAGALALALGLGAVAPAVAAESKEYSGAELVLEQYEAELKDVNAKREKYLKAKALLDAADKELKDAKAAYEAALKAYKDLLPVGYVYVPGKTPQDIAKVAEKDAEATLNEYLQGWTANATTDINLYLNGSNGKIHVEYTVDNVKKSEDFTFKAKDTRSLKNYLTFAFGEHKKANISDDQLAAAVDQYVNEIVAAYKVSAPNSKTLLAYQTLKSAQFRRDAAQTKYEQVEKDTKEDIDAYDIAFTKLEKLAKTYGYVVQVGNNGVKLVKEGEARIKAPGQKATRAELIKELKAEVERNRAAVASAEFLLKYTPKTVAKVEGKLKAQIVDAKAAIEKAEKALAKVEKKAAFIATAYADDEEVSDEDLESLIKDNKESADNLENTMKENEKAQPEVEEKKPEEKKPEEKKEEKTPSKKAGNNARTGIAGVAGVAGILAAASVAYAASKRD